MPQNFLKNLFEWRQNQQLDVLFENEKNPEGANIASFNYFYTLMYPVLL